MVLQMEQMWYIVCLFEFRHITNDITWNITIVWIDAKPLLYLGALHGIYMLTQEKDYSAKLDPPYSSDIDNCDC